MSGPYNNRNRGRGGNRPYNNQNNKNRRSHDYQQQVQQQQPSSSNNNSQELNNGVYANERFMHTTMALIGAVAKVTVKSGKVYEGVFKTFSPQFEVVLEKVHEVDLNDPTSIPFREEIKSQMVFKLEDIAAVVYVNVDPYFAIADGFTDAAISRKANGQAGEKELQPWVSDTNPEDALDDVDILESGKSNGWDAIDMFRTNRDKFQIESTYDPNMGQYTTPLPAHNTEEFKMYEENAAMVAREIESSLNYKQRVELENTKDEETLHSAVVRESQSSKNQQRQRQDGGQYGERGMHCGPRVNKTYTSSGMMNSTSTREASPSRQQPQKTGPSTQAVSDPASTPHSNYSDAVAKKHLTSSIQNHTQPGHHHATTAGSSQAGQAAFTSSVPSSASGSLSTPGTGVNGFKHHVLPEQSQAQSADWKVHHPTGTASGSYGGVGGHQQQSDVVSGHHHHSQQPAHHKDATIKDLKEFQNNFNLTDMSQLPVSQQPGSVQASVSAIESMHIQPVSSAPASQPASECVASSIPSAATTPTSSKSLVTSNGSLSTDVGNTDSSEKKKEVTYTLNPNANEFRPRNASAVSLDGAIGQAIQPLQAMPAANVGQQQSAPPHMQHHKSAGNQAQTQQLVPSTVASPPVMYSNPAMQQFAVAPHMPPGPIFYCPSAVTPRYSGGTKRATVSARGNSEVATPQATNLMAGPPLISQNGMHQMFITPQQMMNFSSYNSLRLMTPVILEHVPHNPMLLSTPMIPPLPAPPHGTPTAVMHPLLQQQQQIVAQQQQQPSNNSNGGGGRPNSNGSGAPTPVHYHPMPQQAQGHNQGVGHHQQQQQQQQQQQTPTQIYHGTPSASLALQAHAPQQMTVPSGSQIPNSMQSQMLFSPFIPTFANHHPQSAGFTAAMPPPAISGTLQGQLPPGALQHHQLVQHPQFQPMIIASQNQQVAAAAQLGQFVAVPGLPQGPPNIASPQLLYGMPPTIQPSMTGQSFQHGQ